MAGTGMGYTWGYAFGGNFFDFAGCKVTASDPGVIKAYQFLYDWAKALDPQKSPDLRRYLLAMAQHRDAAACADAVLYRESCIRDHRQLGVRGDERRGSKSLILPTFFGNPFFIFLLRQFMLQIPSNLSEAARIDGANEFQIMYRIILPLTRPALVVVALLAGVNAWNDFLGPLIYLQNDKLYTLSLGLTFFKTMHGIQFNLLMAASCLVVLPVVAVFLVFQRFFIEGISLGGK
jgi:hypothetical protein